MLYSAGDFETTAGQRPLNPIHANIAQSLKIAPVCLSDTGGVDWLNLAAMSSNVTVDLSASGGITADDGSSAVTLAAFEAATQIENAVAGD